MHNAIDAALEQDSDFATALAFKAFLHAAESLAGPVFVGPNFGAEDQRRLISLAKHYAQRAVEIDITQARVHWVLGWAHVLKREWSQSYRCFDRALDLNPNDYIVLNGAAWSKLNRGDIDTSLKLMERSIALNPGDIANHGNFAGLLYWCERWEDFERQENLMISLTPDAPGPYAELAMAASLMGDAESVRINAALAEARAGTPYFALAFAYSRIGDEAKAQQMVARAEAAAHGSSTRSWIQAPVEGFWEHVALNDYDLALDHLERAIDEGFPWDAPRDVQFLSHHPSFDPVRGHPKFQQLLQKTSLPLDHD